jgi:hypothetical protein
MKTSSLAFAAVLLAGAFSVAAPAFASDDDTPSFDGDWYVTQLQHKGVNAVAAYEGAPDQVRAVVQLADGQQVFQYFDEDTLAPLNGTASAPQTRVLSKLDVKAPGHPANWASQPTIQTEDDQND